MGLPDDRRDKTEYSRVTVYDVARHAGTSASTVSRVLNGSALIAGETREAVLSAARMLGYVARSVRRPGRTVLNIVVFLPQSAEPHAHLFYDAAALFTGVQSGLGEQRAHTITALNGSTSPFQGKKLGDIDGCIFAFCDPQEGVRTMLAQREIPAVVINRADGELASVLNDYEAGMRALATEIARRRPGERVAYLSVRTAEPVARYRWEALRGQPTLSLTDGDRFEFASVGELTRGAVREVVDAGYRVLVCANDLVAIAAYERLLQQGLRVPEDVGLTGYDAAPARDLVSVPITTVELGVCELGREAARLLVEAMLSRTTPRGRITFAGELHTGATL